MNEGVVRGQRVGLGVTGSFSPLCSPGYGDVVPNGRHSGHGLLLIWDRISVTWSKI